MRIQLTLPYIIAFIALNLIMGELHEQTHITTGYFICGCYGPRDFNVWSTCGQCALPQWSFLATLAGPLFSYSMMWLGAFWVAKSSDNRMRVFGFSLLFANLPFARIFTALMGGGDEKVVIQAIAGDMNPIITKIIAALLVFLICLPPMIIAYRKIIAQKRFLWIAGFAITPLIYGMLYHHMFLNWLLKKGIAAETRILGTPNLVLLHFLLMLLILILFRKSLFQSDKNLLENSPHTIGLIRTQS